MPEPGFFSRWIAPRLVLAALLLVVSVPLLPARAEVAELRIARQYGISHLQMALLDHLKLIEKHAAEAGLTEFKVSWTRFSDGPGMNEALLSGNLDIANGGLTALIILFDNSKGAYAGLTATKTTDRRPLDARFVRCCLLVRKAAREGGPIEAVALESTQPFSRHRQAVLGLRLQTLVVARGKGWLRLEPDAGRHHERSARRPPAAGRGPDTEWAPA